VYFNGLANWAACLRERTTMLEWVSGSACPLHLRFNSERFSTLLCLMSLS